MNTIEEAERRELVDLFRGLSPRSLRVEPPRLDPDLEELVLKKLPHPPKAILFDVYGTLLVSAAGGEPAFGVSTPASEGREARALLDAELVRSDYGKDASSFIAEIASLVNKERAVLLSRTPNPEIEIVKVMSLVLPGRKPASLRRIALLLEAVCNPCAPMPGAIQLLERLATSAVRIGIVSNAQFYTPILIEALLGAPLSDLGFDERLTAFSCQSGIAKPDPALYFRVAANLQEAGISKGEILMVGNSYVNDIAPAAALGFMTALFAGDARSFRPAGIARQGLRPDSVLPDLGSLWRLICPGEEEG
jgi:putative hydrolase of the HAD superfamily